MEVRSYEEEDYGRAGRYRRSSGFGFATNTAMADDYGATVTYSGTTATVTFPAGTFQPNESVTVYYDDAIVADVQQIAEVSKTFTAKQMVP